MIESKTNKELERKIDLYINGELNAEETDALWAELIQDEYYLDYMKSVANIKAIIDRKHLKKRKPSASVFPKVAQYAAAAVILIAAFVGIWNMNPTGGLSVEPVDHIGLDVVRDAEGTSAMVTNDVIKEAIRLATDGDTEQAIVLLQNELGNTSDAQNKADVALSLGSIYYNIGKYTESIENFEIVTSQENIEVLTIEKGYWFLGNTYFQLDRLEEAEEAFRNAYKLDGAYSRMAKTYIEAFETVGE